jgi:hypothetical protein
MNILYANSTDFHDIKERHEQRQPRVCGARGARRFVQEFALGNRLDVNGYS